MSIDEQESSQGSENKIPSSLGAWLKQAREEAGFTIEDIARALKLAGSTVQDLERDRMDHIGAPIYYRGFVRSYAKILELPEVAVESRLNDLINEDPMPQAPEGTMRVRRSRWMERYTLMASYVVGTALVLPLLYWLVSSDGSTRQLSEQTAPGIDLPKPERTQSQSQIDAGNSDDAPLSMATATTNRPAAPPSNDRNGAEEQVSAPVAASLTPFGLGRGAAAPVTTTEQLTLELDQASWVSLEDGQGERLVYRTLSAGRHQFGGSPPLKLRLGNVTGSRLFIAGQAVDLQAYQRGNVANLTFTSNEQGTLQAEPAEQPAQ